MLFTFPFMVMSLIIRTDAGCTTDRHEFEAIRFILGMFVPQCEKNGVYISEQCHYSISQCWCVTKFGEEIPNTRIFTDDNFGAPKRDCQEERRKFIQTKQNLEIFENFTSNEIKNQSDHFRHGRQANVTATVQANGTLASNGNSTLQGNITLEIRNVTAPPNTTNANQTTVAPTNQTTPVPITNQTGNASVAAPLQNGTQPANVTIVVRPQNGTQINVTNGNMSINITLAPTATNATQAPATNATQPNATTNATTPPPNATTTTPPNVINVTATINVTTEINVTTRMNVTTQVNVTLQVNVTTPPPNVTQAPQNITTTTPTINQTLSTRPTNQTINPLFQNGTVTTQAPLNVTTAIGPQNDTRPTTPRSLNTSGDADNNTCGANTIYSLCATPCPNGCDRPDDDQCTITTCTAGCVCASGYVRLRSNDTRSPCIRQSTCGQAVVQPANVQICPDPNSAWSTCGTPCEETCQFRPSNCPRQCAAGCFCRDGYVKESSNSTALCIPRNQCVQSAQPYQQQCPDPNATLSNCGTACEESCDYRPTTCALQCVTGCFCKDGYVKQSRVQTARCVPRNQCPPVQNQYGQNQQRGQQRQLRSKSRCEDPNSTWSNCGTSCQETCRLRSAYCTTPCMAGCFCNDGFVRNSNSTNAICILRSDCPKFQVARSG